MSCYYYVHTYAYSVPMCVAGSLQFSGQMYKESHFRLTMSYFRMFV